MMRFVRADNGVLLIAELKILGGISSPKIPGASRCTSVSERCGGYRCCRMTRSLIAFIHSPIGGTYFHKQAEPLYAAVFLVRRDNSRAGSKVTSSSICIGWSLAISVLAVRRLP